MNEGNVLIITTGGTIDKIYFDELSEFCFQDSFVPGIMQEANVQTRFEVRSLFAKDSLDLGEGDVELLINTIQGFCGHRVLITHGTDRMVETGLQIAKACTDKVVVLTGSFAPTCVNKSDAKFNVGFGFAVAQLVPVGVWIAINGDVLPVDGAKKNRPAGCFERMGRGIRKPLVPS